MLILLFLAALLVPLSAQDLRIGSSDLRIEASTDAGYYLYIRKVAGVQSVLITESTEDPARKVASYALRNPVYHPENGDEKRMLDGQMLSNKDRYSLIDSTPMSDAGFGQAFRIYIPYVIVFGYPNARYGQIQVLDGSYLSIRAFSKPYADYTGVFTDNPFVIRIAQAARSEKTALSYLGDTVRSYTDLTKDSDGKLIYSKGEADLLRDLTDLLGSIRGDDLDFVLVLDATKSMENDAPFLRDQLVPYLNQLTKSKISLRCGVVQYRDYLEDFLYKITPLQSSFGTIQESLNTYRPAGGRDTPEAVNEALFAAINEFDWKAKNRVVVLVGDAPPHPIPRGLITSEMVKAIAKEKSIIVHAVILPQ